MKRNNWRDLVNQMVLFRSGQNVSYGNFKELQIIDIGF